MGFNFCSCVTKTDISFLRRIFSISQREGEVLFGREFCDEMQIPLSEFSYRKKRLVKLKLIKRRFKLRRSLEITRLGLNLIGVKNYN